MKLDCMFWNFIFLIAITLVFFLNGGFLYPSGVEGHPEESQPVVITSEQPLTLSTTHVPCVKGLVSPPNQKHLQMFLKKILLFGK